MIQCVLGELDPVGDAADAPGSVDEEEEGSSSTLDAEDGKATGVVQIFDSPIKPPVSPVVMSSLLELVQVPPQVEVTMPIEEGVSGGDAGGSEERGLLPPRRWQRECQRSFRRSMTLPPTMRLRKKRAFPSDAAPLS